MTWRRWWVVALAAATLDCDCGGGGDPGPRDGGVAERDGGVSPLVDVTPPALAPYEGPKDAVFEPFPRGDDFVREGDRNLERMRVAAAWASTRGRPETIVAVLDTGLDPDHPVFRGALVAGRDLVLDSEDMIDTHGHGTSIAAAIAARSSTTAPISGVCDGCRILPIRVSMGDVVGAFDEMDRRLADALRLARDRGATIALVGYTSHRTSPLATAAIEEIVADGVTVIAPAGNDGHSSAAWPARLDTVIGVGASEASVDVARPGSNGPSHVDVWAPADPEFLPIPNGGSARVSGTSLAAAYVAGVAGLLKSLHPDLEPAGVRSLLVATAAPMAPGRSTWVMRGGRVDARELVRAVFPAPKSDRIADLDVRYVETIPERPMPDQAVRIRARIANSGTLPIALDDAVVRLWRNGAAEWFEAGTATLEPGDDVWIEIATTAPSTPGPVPLILQVGEKPGRIIGGPGVVSVVGNDAQPIVLRTFEAPSNLALTEVVTATTSVEIESPFAAVDTPDRDVGVIDTRETTTDEGIEVTAVFANVGNVPVDTGLVATWLGQTEAELSSTTWAPGERRALTVRIDRDDAPLITQWSIEFATTDADDDPDNDRAEILLPSGRASGFHLAYADTPGGNIIFDAPFRVDRARPYVPFLTFVPEWHHRDAVMVCFALWAKASHSPPPRGFWPFEARSAWRAGHRLFHVHRDGPADQDEVHTADGVAWTPIAIDENGRMLTNQYFGQRRVFAETYGAWHRVLRVPWSVVDAKIPTQASPYSVYFLTQATVRRPDQQRRGRYVYRNYSAVLRVRRDALPRFAGRSADRYYDAHFHTIAEGANGILELPEPFDNPQPAQSWAAPIAMIAESAYAHGFTEDPAMTKANLKNRVVTTDHNQFYSSTDSGAPEDWTPGSGPTGGQEGSMAFDTMREYFDRGAGEEVAVKGGPDVSWFAPPIGLHMLAYDAAHVEGPWHGGDSNPHSIPMLLNRLRAESDDTPAAAYPAHPFLVVPDITAPQWTFDDMEMLLGLQPYNFFRAFDDDMVPVGRGFQIWNQKVEYRYAGLAGADLRRADPWGVLQWDATLSGLWVHQLKLDVRRWNYLIRRGLHYELQGVSPRVVYHRKLFGVGGTDAHGDFNYMQNISATAKINIVHTLITRRYGGRDNLYYSSNAWGKVRSYAFTEDDDPAAAVDAMVHGRSVVTDGPLLRIEVDADARLDSTTFDYDLGANDLTTAHFDADGFMGGAGRMDGEGTVVILAPDAGEGGFGTRLVEPLPSVRYTAKNPTGLHDGRPLQELAMWNLESTENNLRYANRCQLVSGPFPDDTDAILPLFDPTRPYPFGMKSGATFAHAATATFTEATANGSCIMHPDRVGRPDLTHVAVTNPVWWTLGAYQLLVDGTCLAGGNAQLDRLEARVTFPISTSTTGRIFVQALDTNGRSTGPRVYTTSSRIEVDQGIAGRRLVAEWPNLQMGLAANNLDGAGSGSFVVVIESISDAVGNVLNPVAMVRHLGACQIGSNCCDLNPSAADHRCFGVSRHFMCNACGDGCTGGERCDPTGPGPYVCTLDLGSGCGANCACCYNNRCLDGADLSRRDDSCGRCGAVCQPGTRCCDSGCRALDDPAHCGACGQACMTGDTCCPQRFGHACTNLQEDPTNCGACGKTCAPDEQCCGGTCYRLDDPAHCGACASAACTIAERCCWDNAAYACTRVDSNENCGACGERCVGDETCQNGMCVE